MNWKGFCKVYVLIVLFAAPMTLAMNEPSRRWRFAATGGIFGLGISVAYHMGHRDRR